MLFLIHFEVTVPADTPAELKNNYVMANMHAPLN